MADGPMHAHNRQTEALRASFREPLYRPTPGTQMSSATQAVEMVEAAIADRKDCEAALVAAVAEVERLRAALHSIATWTALSDELTLGVSLRGALAPMRRFAREALEVTRGVG